MQEPTLFPFIDTAVCLVALVLLLVIPTLFPQQDLMRKLRRWRARIPRRLLPLSLRVH